MSEEGYIKFQAHWQKAKLANFDISELNNLRTKLYNLGLIGINNEGIGFGNVSQRIKKSKKFIITGTCTGGLPILTKNHYTIVEKCNIKHNEVSCKGPINASSESMSHGTIYHYLPNINTVIHIHNHDGWKKLLNKIPTTSANARYGTPELADEIKRLLKETNLEEIKIFVTAGHPDGIFCFGRDIQEAEKVLMKRLNSFNK